ncbi:MAG: hypothetical protein JNL83_26605 [Myxococcales bacterium]|nr:hypothetical protein [Myxococcales bacterium]
MVEGVITKADPGAAGWAIRDAVTQLRHRGTDVTFPLVGPPRLLAGTATACAIRIDEGLGASREHAAFERRGDEWLVTLDRAVKMLEAAARRNAGLYVTF